MHHMSRRLETFAIIKRVENVSIFLDFSSHWNDWKCLHYRWPVMLRYSSRLFPCECLDENQQMAFMSQKRHSASQQSGVKFTITLLNTWWLHDMETLTELLALHAVNFPHKGPVMQNFYVFPDVSLKKPFKKQLGCQWCEMSWCSYDISVMKLKHFQSFCFLMNDYEISKYCCISAPNY